MTQSELIEKLNTAQSLLSDVYHWADAPLSNGLQVSPLKTNAEIASALSFADGCICDALDELEDMDE